ncbi:MAG: hypothetical protein LBW77_05130, partial [Verrucomicrobiota bacterium]|nr:hypothetical protein [Verrucomicrobiota bacterium]
MKLNRWLMLCGCLVAACSLSAQNWTAGSSPLVAAGTTVTVNGTEPPLACFTNNGTINVIGNGSITVTGLVAAASVGNGVGESGTLTLSGSGTFTKTGASGAIAVGYLGGHGELDIGPGTSFTSSMLLRIAANESATRDLPSTGALTVSGALTAPSLEFTAFFSEVGATVPPYGVPVSAAATLNAGGVLTIGRLTKNDRGAATFTFNGGMLKASATAELDFIVGNGEMDMIIADGRDAVFDTSGKEIRIIPRGAPLQQVLALRGNGGLVKAGAGNLIFSLPAVCNTFTGPVQVLAGTLDLGRPLAAGQTATVSAGANFVPHGAGDLPKITYLGTSGEKQLYTVAEDTDTLDLSSSTMFDDTRLGGPFSGTFTLSNALTHAAGGTAADPFRLIGQGGTLNLTNTGLETAVLRVEGPGTFNFQGTRTYTAADVAAGRLVITDGGYRQSPAFLLSDPNSATPAALALTSGRFEVGTLLMVGTNGFGAFAADGVAVAGGGVSLGSGTGSVGHFSQSTGTVTLTREVMVGADGGTGYLTVTGGSFIVNADLRIAGNLSGDRTLRPQGTVVISNALARCSTLNFTPNSVNNGTGKTLEVGLLSLLPGGVLELNAINKNDEPISTIVFGGGLMRARGNTGTFLSVQPNGTVRLIAEAGQFIAIDSQANTVTMAPVSGTIAVTGP